MTLLNGGKGYAAHALVDDFVTSGKLPAIHDDMGTIMDLIPHERRLGALDLGACHGLLSVRAAQMGWHPIIGVEIDATASSITYDRVVPAYRATGGTTPIQIEHRPLDVLHPGFQLWMQSRCRGVVNTILARRVFPELFSNSFKHGKEETTWRAAGAAFSDAALATGIEYIVLEGRQWKTYKTHANPLFRLELELDALGSRWKVSHRWKECAIVVPA